jgi:ABC-type dipeptide/oligopeptide/nickel transport system permease subunit
MAETASDATIIVAPGRSVWRGALIRLLRNKLAMAAIAVMLGFILVAVFAPQLAPHPYDFQSRARPDRGNGGPDLPPIWVQTGDPLTSGKPGYWLGTDTLGRDTLSRVIYASRISIPTGFIPLLFTLPFGVAVGLATGYLGGRVDGWLMRITDAVYAIPQLLLVVLVAFILRPTPIAEPLQGMVPVFLALALTGWVTLARLVRGQALTLKEQEFIVAARAVGMSPARIMLRYLLPNMAGPVITAAALSIPLFIVTEIILEFMGVSARLPYPTWGGMIAAENLVRDSSINVIWPPAVCMTIISLAFVFISDGLRDALDPR